jgi:hypothetical protein
MSMYLGLMKCEIYVCMYVAALRRADYSSKESYQLSISVRLRNLITGGLGPTWAEVALNKNNMVS